MLNKTDSLSDGEAYEKASTITAEHWQMVDRKVPTRRGAAEQKKNKLLYQIAIKVEQLNNKFIAEQERESETQGGRIDQNSNFARIVELAKEKADITLLNSSYYRKDFWHRIWSGRPPDPVYIL